MSQSHEAHNLENILADCYSENAQMYEPALWSSLFHYFDQMSYIHTHSWMTYELNEDEGRWRPTHPIGSSKPSLSAFNGLVRLSLCLLQAR